MSNHWEFYYTAIDDQPVGILVDMGIAGVAPRTGLPQLVLLRIPLLQTDEHGLPTEESHALMDRVEDALEDGLEGIPAETDYVGRFTTQGSRVFFYYSSDASAVEAGLKSTMSAFPEFSVETRIESDPEWNQYFETLHPNEREEQVIANGHILQSLQNAGDHPEVVREVQHWVYFPNAEARGSFEQRVQQLGYQTTERQDQSVGPNPFSLCVSKPTSLEDMTINDVVLELFDLAQEYDADYTGWETSVQRSLA